MIIFNNQIILHSKSVVVDLMTRSGLATSESYSPYLGCSYLVEKYIGNIETLASIEILMQGCPDFNADVIKPQYDEDEYSTAESDGEILSKSGKDYNPEFDPIVGLEYLRRLEDISFHYLEKYIGNLVFRIVKQTGLVNYEMSHPVQPTLISSDDSEDTTELADLVVDVNEKTWSTRHKTDALTDLPYVLRRLDNLSKITKVHMLSMLVAYRKASDQCEIDRLAGHTKELKRNAVLAFGVYSYSQDGYVQKLVTIESKNKHTIDMFEWIVNPQIYTAYVEDAKKFLYYIDVLNIDLDDDYSKYNSAFLKQLCVAHITPASVYLMQVYDSIFDGNPVRKYDIENYKDPVETTMNMFEQAMQTDEKLKIQQDKMVAEAFINYRQMCLDMLVMYRYYCNDYEEVSKRDVSFVNGWLYYKDELCVFHSKLLEDQRLTQYSFLLNEFGYLVNVNTKVCSIHPVMLAKHIIESRLNGDTSEKVEWRIC